MKKPLQYLLAAGITLLLSAAYYYIALPPINVQSVSFWTFLIIIFILFLVVNAIISLAHPTETPPAKNSNLVRVNLILIAIPIVVMIIGGIISSKLFHAASYASIINIEDAVFEEDMPETTSVTNIALMDTESAQIIGNRTLGSLADVVSQYTISSDYSQINYQGLPKKVANLEYDGFFKWLNNKSNGVPGFVMVDPVNSAAEYIELDTPLKYVDSAYFSKDLNRALRFAYPTKIFDTITFEIDESGKPYFIISCLKANVGLFGAKDVSEVIIFNPCDGTSEIYSVADTPSWIDNVYSGYLASDKYNWYGTLSGGFWNSIIGNKNCKETTDDFGYIMMGDDVWYFTGVTSVTSDESNIGFIISNARTGAYKFYSVVGAEEYSAMAAAEGEVQEKGYTASFPSLVNISGQATYIMVLKDDGGLVKLYALVNVENYSIVATGATQSEAISAYKKLLATNNVISSSAAESEYVTKTITVDNVRIITVDNVPIVYITDQDGLVYKSNLTDDERLILIRTGDSITVKCTDSGTKGIFILNSWT